MAAHLSQALGPRVDVVVAPFETAPLPAGRFDLAVAGTAPGMGVGDGELPFQLDEGGPRAELAHAGFEDVRSSIIWTTLELTAHQAQALYASLAVVLRLSAGERRCLLDAIGETVSSQHGGFLQRQVPTAVYTATRP